MLGSAIDSAKSVSVVAVGGTAVFELVGDYET